MQHLFATVVRDISHRYTQRMSFLYLQQPCGGHLALLDHREPIMHCSYGWFSTVVRKLLNNTATWFLRQCFSVCHAEVLELVQDVKCSCRRQSLPCFPISCITVMTWNAVYEIPPWPLVRCHPLRSPALQWGMVERFRMCSPRSWLKYAQCTKQIENLVCSSVRKALSLEIW